MDRPYEAINGTVRPASVFLKEDCGLEFVVAEISYGEFIRKFIKKLFFFTRFNLLIIRIIGRLLFFVFRPIAQIAGWNVLQSLMCTGDLSDSNV